MSSVSNNSRNKIGDTTNFLRHFWGFLGILLVRCSPWVLQNLTSVQFTSQCYASVNLGSKWYSIAASNQFRINLFYLGSITCYFPSPSILLRIAEQRSLPPSGWSFAPRTKIELTRLRFTKKRRGWDTIMQEFKSFQESIVVYCTCLNFCSYPLVCSIRGGC